VLGWKILKEGEYKLALPILSEEEEEIIEAIEARFREIVRIKDFKGKEDVLNTISYLLKRIAQEEGFVVDPDQHQYLVEMAYRHMYGLLYFDDLLEDESIEEISFIGLGKPTYVYVRKEGWKKVNATITSEDVLIDVINKMAKVLGRRITYQNPRLDATLPDGSRLHASIPPISEGEITIRKFKAVPLSVKDIIAFDTFTADVAALLSLFMQADMNILVGGNTASGKTTTLNALFAFVPLNERVLITEETPEINIMHEHKVRLVANKDMGVTLMDLIYDSLRMRPDRIIVGEVRNAEEAMALLDVLLGGQARGAYATFHAQSGKELLKRLVSMGISSMDVNAIDVLIIQRRMLVYEGRQTVERRKLTEVSIVEEGKAHPLITFNPVEGLWERHDRNIERALKRLSYKIGLSEKEIREVWREREQAIEEAPALYKDFFSHVQKAFYSLGG